MSDAPLTTQQLEVICALSNGATITAAAAQAGVHRNTVASWRRNHPNFRQSLADAHYHRAIFFREHAEELFASAMKVVAGILDNPDASDSVRLKAALAIIHLAITPPAAPQHDTMHIRAQPLAQPDARPLPSQPLHNAAQAHAPLPVRRETHKIGRNDACPCGSGIKYKRCCLDKPGGVPLRTPEARAA